nr:60S ribosomal protein L28-2-like [Tanacetum cinerariifolium]
MVASGGTSLTIAGQPLTSTGPSINHRSTVVDRQGQVGLWTGSGSGRPRGMPRVSHVCPRGIHVDADVDITTMRPGFLDLMGGRGSEVGGGGVQELPKGHEKGLANKRTVTIQPAGKDQSILLATTKTKKQSKPASLLHKSVMKKEFYRMAKAVSNQ